MDDKIISAIPGTGGIMPDPIAIADETWLAEGKVIIPSDHPLARNVDSRSDADEVFIISASRDVSRVRRTIKNTTTDFELGYGWVTTADCVWVGNEPFAVMVHKTVRQPYAGKSKFVRKMSLALYWSHQSIKGGEIKRPIEVADLPVTTVSRPNGDVHDWVRLDLLSKRVNITAYDLRRGFLWLTVLADPRQPSCVFAENEFELAIGPLDRKFEVEGAAAHRPTGFPPKGPSDEIPASQVWVALSAAESILRLISLGVKEHLDLFPVHYI